MVFMFSVVGCWSDALCHEAAPDMTGRGNCRKSSTESVVSGGEGGASRTGSEPQKGGDCIVLLVKKEKGKETMYSC
jgi:hypothetical protein